MWTPNARNKIDPLAWHDQTESLHATVDSCFAVFAARQHSVGTSLSD